MGIQAVENPTSADRLDAAPAGRRAAQIAGVAIVTAAVAAIYSVYSLVLYSTDRDSSYDLVIFDQAVRSYSHFQPGISIIKGVHNGFGPHFSVLGDHFSPILAALAPLYWIYDGPQTLLVAQAVLVALAIPPLWVFARRAFGGTGWKATTAAYLVTVAYGLSWPVATAVAFDFHEVAFAPVLTAVALERLQAGRLRTALVALGFLLLVKEDMGILVAGLGIALAASPTQTVRRQRLVGLILVVAGIGYTIVATYLLIPAFGGRADYYWAFSSLGNNVPQVVAHLLRHPLAGLQMLVTPPVKLHTMWLLVAVFGILPLLSPLTLAVLPLLAERMLNSRYHNWWTAHFQYNAYLVVILACAAVLGAARLDCWVARALTAWSTRANRRADAPDLAADTINPAADTLSPAADTLSPAADTLSPAADAPGPAADTLGSATVSAVSAGPATKAGAPAPAAVRTRPAGATALACGVLMLAATLYTLPRFPLGEALHASFYRQTPRSRAAAAVDARVPTGVRVEAANVLGPELSSRDTVLMWDGEHAPLGSPWVVADVRRREMTFTRVSTQRARVALLLRSGYTIVYSRDGYLVLHRVGRNTAGAIPPKGSA